MRARARAILLLPLLALAGCQMSGGVTPTTPAPAACDLAGFGAAPGLDLATLKPKARRKSAPAPAGIAVGQSIADTGKWVDAAPGWRAWRYWVRSETTTSIKVQLDPFSLPPAAQFWLCSPDRTTRQGPITGKGLGDVGRYGSPEVSGQELWLEVIAPAGTEKDVQLVIAEVFAGSR